MTNKYDFSDTDNALLTCFHIDHPHLSEIVTKQQVLDLVNLSPSFRSWYLRWKELRRVYNEKPSFLDDSEEDMKEWENLRTQQIKLREMERKWQKEVSDASKTMREVISSVEARKKDYYEKIPVLLVISKIGPEQLREQDLVKVALEGDKDKREALLSKFVLSTQKHYLRQYRETGSINNPFLKKDSTAA